jgi:hypothetical protein
MTTLVLKDRGWVVATSAWTAAAKPGQSVEVAYLWGEDGAGWFDSATGVSRVALTIPIAEFLARLPAEDVVDLQEVCVS